MARKTTSRVVKIVGRGDVGWQAQKSAMTRECILDAAVNCFVEVGYASTTTATIAARAGVSRGAMQHHFASKAELIRAAVEHLHDKLVERYRNEIEAVSRALEVDERNRRGLSGYWKYLCSDLYTAYHEMCVAGRTDPELQRILEGSIDRFDQAIRESNVLLFPEWAQKGDRFDLAMDISKFLMEGLAVAMIVNQREQRAERMISYLADRLEEIFHEQDANAAILRHAVRDQRRTTASADARSQGG